MQLNCSCSMGWPHLVRGSRVPRETRTICIVRVVGLPVGVLSRFQTSCIWRRVYWSMVPVHSASYSRRYGACISSAVRTSNCRNSLTAYHRNFRYSVLAERNIRRDLNLNGRICGDLKSYNSEVIFVEVEAIKILVNLFDACRSEVVTFRDTGQ
jgi:hypothetical protein